jgi:integrase
MVSFVFGASAIISLSRCFPSMLSRSTQPTPVQYLLGHASFTMTLDRYPHWIPSMGRHAAEGMDEALG